MPAAARAKPRAGSIRSASRPASSGQPTASPRRSSRLGVVSIFFGVLAFGICWVPFVNLLGMPIAGLGLVLALVGLIVSVTRGGVEVAYPMAGLVLCGMSAVVAVAMTRLETRMIPAAPPALQENMMVK